MTRIASIVALTFGVVMTTEATAADTSPWTERVTYTANHKGQTPFTVEANAYRVKSGKVVVSLRHTKIAIQPGDIIEFADGTKIVAEKVSRGGDFNNSGTMIDAPIPPPLKAGTVSEPLPPGKPVKK